MTDRRRTLATLGSGLLLAGISGVVRAQRAAASTRCGPTGRATAGPFYVANAPATTDINLLDAPGMEMRVSALVLGGTDLRTPLSGAIVELWHADADGHYHPEGAGDVSRYAPHEINLRGQAATDATGRANFRSIVPGRYGNRRRHLHWRVVAPGYDALVTQTYWRDEKGTRHERGDPVDRGAEDCRWVEFHADGGASVGEVVFVLAAGRPAALGDYVTAAT